MQAPTPETRGEDVMGTASKKPTQRMFADDADQGPRRVVLPWSRAFGMCLANVRHRLGRSMLTFVCIAVVIAFFMQALSYQRMLATLMASPDVHVQAVLERAGVFTHDEAALKRQHDQRVWLYGLSGFLCLVGITNTILMSVTERFREIGTLKCMGALDAFVVRLFLIENIVIGALASLAGCLAGYGLAAVQVAAVFEPRLLGAAVLRGGLWPALPLVLAVGTLLTLLAAIYPTHVASRMRPADAMRTEI
jgi:putative ABC transport system permease protein